MAFEARITKLIYFDINRFQVILRFTHRHCRINKSVALRPGFVSSSCNFLACEKTSEYVIVVEIVAWQLQNTKFHSSYFKSLLLAIEND